MVNGLAVTGSFELAQRMRFSSPPIKLHSAPPSAVPAPITLTSDLPKKPKKSHDPGFLGQVTGVYGRIAL
jgi:hypothetical protein